VASVTKMAGYHAANAVDITDLAVAMEAAVRVEASGHVLTSHYMSGIHTERDTVKGVTHHVVIVQDENVYAIEWGHYVWGAFDSDERVPGQFILTNAFRAMVGG
jgi:hypothetical protein